jgi:hypothetical protein
VFACRVFPAPCFTDALRPSDRTVLAVKRDAWERTRRKLPSRTLPSTVLFALSTARRPSRGDCSVLPSSTTPLAPTSATASHPSWVIVLERTVTFETPARRRALFSPQRELSQTSDRFPSSPWPSMVQSSTRR